MVFLRAVAGAAVSLVMCTLAAPASAAMSHCLGLDGAVVFTQFDCPPDTVRVAASDPEGVLSVVTSPALTDAERRRLQSLDTDLTRARQARRRERASRARAREKARHATEQRCAEAERALESIDSTRRKGYTAAEARRLDSEEQRWRRLRRSSC
ncbi:MAG: hypothetical protein P8Y69_01930 [Gammaproteobacteria bacterium]|jgi:hypothetical protein